MAASLIAGVKSRASGGGRSGRYFTCREPVAHPDDEEAELGGVRFGQGGEVDGDAVRPELNGAASGTEPDFQVLCALVIASVSVKSRYPLDRLAPVAA